MSNSPETSTFNAQSLSQVTENLNRLIAEPASSEAVLQEVYSIESPIARAMELIGDKYSFQIIHILYQLDRQRFVEIENQVTGISPRTLSARLKHLEKCGLITRHQFPTIPPKVEYELTDRGRDLATTLNALETWADKWYSFRPAAKV